MKGRFSITLLLLCSILTNKAQNLDSILSVYAKDRGYDTLTYTLGKTPKWLRNAKAKTFINNFSHNPQSVNHYLAMNDDATFVFLVFYEPGIDMTIGRWEKKNDSLVVLNWNKTETIQAFTNKQKWRNYSTYFSGTPFKIDNWTFIVRDSILVPISRKDEILSASFY